MSMMCRVAQVALEKAAEKVPSIWESLGRSAATAAANGFGAAVGNAMATGAINVIKREPQRPVVALPQPKCNPLKTIEDVVLGFVVIAMVILTSNQPRPQQNFQSCYASRKKVGGCYRF